MLRQIAHFRDGHWSYLSAEKKQGHRRTFMFEVMDVFILFSFLFKGEYRVITQSRPEADITPSRLPVSLKRIPARPKLAEVHACPRPGGNPL